MVNLGRNSILREIFQTFFFRYNLCTLCSVDNKECVCLHFEASYISLSVLLMLQNYTHTKRHLVADTSNSIIFNHWRGIGKSRRVMIHVFVTFRSAYFVVTTPSCDWQEAVTAHRPYSPIRTGVVRKRNSCSSMAPSTFGLSEFERAKTRCMYVTESPNSLLLQAAIEDRGVAGNGWCTAGNTIPVRARAFRHASCRYKRLHVAQASSLVQGCLHVTRQQLNEAHMTPYNCPAIICLLIVLAI